VIAHGEDFQKSTDDSDSNDDDDDTAIFIQGAVKPKDIMVLATKSNRARWRSSSDHCWMNPYLNLRNGWWVLLTEMNKEHESGQIQSQYEGKENRQEETQ